MTSQPNPRSLTQMQRYGTSYEVAVTANGTTQRLAFTARQTKSNLLQIAQNNGDLIISLMGDWDGEATYIKAAGWTFGPVRVYFTGRTEREVANEMGLI